MRNCGCRFLSTDESKPLRRWTALWGKESKSISVPSCSLLYWTSTVISWASSLPSIKLILKLFKLLLLWSIEALWLLLSTQVPPWARIRHRVWKDWGKVLPSLRGKRNADSGTGIHALTWSYQMTCDDKRKSKEGPSLLDVSLHWLVYKFSVKNSTLVVFWHSNCLSWCIVVEFSFSN